MAPFYTKYMIRHSAGLTRFVSLEANPTPAMKQYLEHTKAISMAHSNAWDLASLLIKPVQRFTKYPLLLSAILDSTPQDHGDYQNLVKAKASMLDAVKLVNEESRKWDVVRAVLEGKGLKGVASPAAAALATAGSMSRVKSLRSGLSIGKLKDKERTNFAGAGAGTPTIEEEGGLTSPGLVPGADDWGGQMPGGALDDLTKRVKDYEMLMLRFAGEVIQWNQNVRDSLLKLANWTTAFERVITLGEQPGVEALQAFRTVISGRLTEVMEHLVCLPSSGNCVF